MKDMRKQAKTGRGARTFKRATKHAEEGGEEESGTGSVIIRENRGLKRLRSAGKREEMKKGG